MTACPFCGVLFSDNEVHYADDHTVWVNAVQDAEPRDPMPPVERIARELIIADRESRDLTIVGSTCRLIRAESAVLHYLTPPQPTNAPGVEMIDADTEQRLRGLAMDMEAYSLLSCPDEQDVDCGEAAAAIRFLLDTIDALRNQHQDDIDWMYGVCDDEIKERLRAEDERDELRRRVEIAADAHERIRIAARDAAYELAAKVCERMGYETPWPAIGGYGPQCAAAIRALSSKAGDSTRRSSTVAGSDDEDADALNKASR